MSEKNFNEEEKNLVEVLVMAYMSSQIVDKIPPKSTTAEETRTALIILKDMIEYGRIESAKKILKAACDNISAMNLLAEFIAK